jgi:hypothetical protein
MRFRECAITYLIINEYMTTYVTINVINMHPVYNYHIQVTCQAGLGTIKLVNVVGLVFMILSVACHSSPCRATLYLCLPYLAPSW